MVELNGENNSSSNEALENPINHESITEELSDLENNTRLTSLETQVRQSDSKGKPTESQNSKGKSAESQNSKGKSTESQNPKGKSTESQNSKGKSTESQNSKGKSTESQNPKGESTESQEKKEYTPGKFVLIEEYKVYIYTIKERGTPDRIKTIAVQRGLAKSKDQIIITDKNGNKYADNHDFSAGDKIHVRIKIQADKSPEGGEFRFIDKDKGRNVYIYTIKSHGTPSRIKTIAVQRGLAKSKDQIIITDKDGNKYADNHNFSAGDKVYVRIKTQVEKKEKIESNFEYIEISKDKGRKFENFSLILSSSTATHITIADITEKAKNHLYLNEKQLAGLEVTDSKGTKCNSNKVFKNGEKINLKVPIIENGVKIIDGMKCKGGEYFGIDVSKFNTKIDFERFEKRNYKKWNSVDNNVRGVSFMYIRAGDGHPGANPQKDKEYLTKWANFVKKHNNDRRVKDRHEQIATGFYWVLSNRTNVEKQAENFLKLYNEYKDISGGEKLVPMIDLETDRRGKEVKKIHKNKKGEIIRKEYYTPKEFKEKALQWLQHVEKKTGIVPGIYVGAKAYGDYLKGDNRFNKYLTRLSAYPDNNKYGREQGHARRINFKTGDVNVGSSRNPINVKPTMYQSSQEGTVDGTGAEVVENGVHEDTDMDHTKDITKLFSKNNKSK